MRCRPVLAALVVLVALSAGCALDEPRLDIDGVAGHGWSRLDVEPGEQLELHFSDLDGVVAGADPVTITVHADDACGGLLAHATFTGGAGLELVVDDAVAPTPESCPEVTARQGTLDLLRSTAQWRLDADDLVLLADDGALLARFEELSG